MLLHLQTGQPVNTDEAPYEVVERKGLGHPDTLCDAIAELASRRYAAAVYNEIGRLPHHYFDKVLLMGGSADMTLGRGQLVEPYRVLFAGKVTRRIGELELPVSDIIAGAARDVLSNTLREFDATRYLVVMDELRDHQGPAKRRPRYQPERIEDLPEMAQRGRVSNDANVCTAFFPLTRCERLVLATERHLNSKEYKIAHPYTGMDIKVVGVRIGSDIELTVNMPFISSLVPSMDAYREMSDTVASGLRGYHEATGFPDVRLNFNPQNISGLPYITVTGSVADTGDIGVVGRGNRANGLITPMRPMSIEAVSGKSPIDNTGKLYGIAASRLSEAIHEATGRWNTVAIVTFRDRPLEDPAHVLMSLEGEVSTDMESRIRSIVEQHLAEVPNLTEDLIAHGVICW